MKIGRFKASISLKLTGFMLSVCIFPLLIYQFVSNSTVRQTIIEIASRHSMQLLVNQRDYLNLLLEQIEALATNLGSVSEINEALAGADNSTTMRSIYDGLATKARIGYLLSSYSGLKGLVSIDLFALNGVSYHVGDTLDVSAERKELVSSLMHRTLLERGPIVWHGVEDNVNAASNSRKVVVATRAISRPDRTDMAGMSNSLAGMLLINYSTEHLYDHFSTIDLGEGAYMMVVDARHRLLFHKDKRLIGDLLSPVFSSTLRGESGARPLRLDGKDVLLSYIQIPNKQWYVISVVPQSTLTAAMVNIERTGVAALLVSLLLVSVFMWRYSLHVVAPIRAISDGFGRFQANRLDPAWRLQTSTPWKEISELVRWFNSFLDTMQQRRESEIALRIAATAFESQEGMFVTDADKVIQQVNRAFTEITGYTAEDAVGRNASILRSGRHDAAFYKAMNESVACTGSWQGEVWNRRKNGGIYLEWLTLTAVKNPAGEISHYVGTLTDITTRKEAENEIKHLAFYDPLTELPNRRLLLDRLHQALVVGKRSGHEGALLFIDLDNFKTLNDTLGHDKGDLLLQQVSGRLTACMREGDTVARLGGDEFVVMLENLSSQAADAAAQARMVGEKIIATLNEPYMLAGQVYHSTCSMGISMFHGHESSVEDLLKRADMAMYEAKAAGRNTLRFFDPEMQEAVTARAALDADLRQGMLDNHFLLYYQPQVDNRGRLIGTEVLLRWLHPKRGLVQPADFIAAAEDTGMIVPLGRWVWESACRQQVAWAVRPEMAHLTLAVNVSARQFRQPDFVEQVLDVLDRTGANAHKLKLELTESVLLDDDKDIIEKMSALKARGMGFSLDDFGTGYSSLSYLKRLPLDQLKIDQSFTRDVLSDPNDAAIVRTIVALAQTLSLAVIAEGVETEAQRDFLFESGCHEYQGYLYGKPMPLEEFERTFSSSAEAVENLA